MATPISIDPPSCLPVQDGVTLIPGVSIEYISSTLGKMAAESYDRVLPRSDFTPTHVVITDVPLYVRELLNRLRSQGYSDKQLALEPPPEDWPDLFSEHPLEMHVDARAIVRQVLLSSVLLQRFSFKLGGSVQIEKKTGQATPYFVLSSVGLGVEESSSYFVSSALPKTTPDVIDSNNLCRVFAQLEPYCRPGFWKADRFATALACFWTGLCTPYGQQAFLSMMSIFDALLSTTKTEVTHVISERTSYFLGQTEEERYSTYRQMKKLYNIRSQIVHGDIKMKPGPITLEQLRIDAVLQIVPSSAMAELATKAVTLLKLVLNDSKLMNAIQQQNSDALDEFYLRKSFR